MNISYSSHIICNHSTFTLHAENELENEDKDINNHLIVPYKKQIAMGDTNLVREPALLQICIMPPSTL